MSRTLPMAPKWQTIHYIPAIFVSGILKTTYCTALCCLNVKGAFSLKICMQITPRN